MERKETQEQYEARMQAEVARRKAVRNPRRNRMKGVTSPRKLKALRKKSRQFNS